MAFTPYFFEMMDKREYRYLDKTTGRVFALIMLGALFLIFFGRGLGEIIADESFHEGLQVIPPVVLGYVFFGVFFVYGRFIGYEKKTYLSSILVVTAGVVNVVLNAIFIPRYGYIAAAYTTLASYFLLGFWAWVVARFVITSRATPTKVVGKPLLLLFICLGFYYLAGNAGIPVWLALVVKIILFLTFAAIVFVKDLAEIRNSFSGTAARP
jgi:O-antigen/teichoic acid export membrane protein